MSSENRGHAQLHSLVAGFRPPRPVFPGCQFWGNKERRKYPQMASLRWRAEPDSNRHPATVLRPCFLKHLPPMCRPRD